MKTFETEKRNIPEGATHYRNECKEYQFSWVKFASDSMYLWCETYWDETADYIFECSVKPIPQTNIETPEEKEVDWVNGDECRYNDINWLFCGFHPANGLALVANNDEPSMHQIITVDVNLLSKPETPQQREERERLEAAYDLYCDYCKGTNFRGVDFELFKKPADNREVWLAIVDKTNYRKEG